MHLHKHHMELLMEVSSQMEAAIKVQMGTMEMLPAKYKISWHSSPAIDSDIDLSSVV